MLRPVRLIMMVLIAMFIVAVPTAVAQTPVTDQYSALDDGSAGTSGDDGAGSDVGAGAPVQVRDITASDRDLPFTGGQISLIALLGLGLLAIGAVGVASTRRRTSATPS